MSLHFRLTSYNILADAYATRRLYPDVDPAVLRWQHRAPAIVERVCDLASDVVCLQEVETAAWPELAEMFRQRGWQGVHAAKGAGRPDGCALLYRGDAALRFVGAEPFHFADGIEGKMPSGHLALVATFGNDAGRIRIAGTHLRWQAATSDAAAHIGYRQAQELIDHCAAMSPKPLATIVCGDFNAPPDSALVRLFGERGFVDAYASAKQPTCNPNRRTARIDFIFATPSIAARPDALPALDDATPLPSAAEPSDHLPVSAVFHVAG